MSALQVEQQTKKQSNRNSLNSQFDKSDKRRSNSCCIPAMTKIYFLQPFHWNEKLASLKIETEVSAGQRLSNRLKLSAPMLI